MIDADRAAKLLLYLKIYFALLQTCLTIHNDWDRQQPWPNIFNKANVNTTPTRIQSFNVAIGQIKLYDWTRRTLQFNRDVFEQ